MNAACQAFIDKIDCKISKLTELKRNVIALWDDDEPAPKPAPAFSAPAIKLNPEPQSPSAASASKAAPDAGQSGARPGAGNKYAAALDRLNSRVKHGRWKKVGAKPSRVPQKTDGHGSPVCAPAGSVAEILARCGVKIEQVDPDGPEAVQIGWTLPDHFTLTDLSARIDSPGHPRAGEWLTAWEDWGWIANSAAALWRRTATFGQ